jgi:hypothetical protein
MVLVAVVLILDPVPILMTAALMLSALLTTA